MPRDHLKGVNGYYDARQKQKQTVPPGTLVLSKAVQPAGQPDEMTETRIDLAPALKDGRGNVFVTVEPGVRQRDREILRTWVQVTDIGLDAFVDRDELVGWATSLADGRPLAGVEMTLKDSGGRALSGAPGSRAAPTMSWSRRAPKAASSARCTVSPDPATR